MLNENCPQSVLFVCLGNICRSPAGEAIFRSLAQAKGIADQFLIDSAGTIGFHAGHPADVRMCAAARKRGISLVSQSRKIAQVDFDTFGLIIAMDQDNLRDLLAIHPAPTADIKLLSYFLDGDWPIDVPDPYYGGAEQFEFVLDMIAAACPAILDFMRSPGGP